MADLKADCEAGDDSACEELKETPPPCQKKDAGIQPSFYPPKKDGPKTPFVDHKLKHSEKKQLRNIEGDCLKYQGNHVAKVKLAQTKAPQPQGNNKTIVLKPQVVAAPAASSTILVKKPAVVNPVVSNIDTNPPIGTGFQPDSDVTIHRNQVRMEHPGGPQNTFYEKIETTEVRSGKARKDSLINMLR